MARLEEIDDLDVEGLDTGAAAGAGVGTGAVAEAGGEPAAAGAEEASPGDEPERPEKPFMRTVGYPIILAWHRNRAVPGPDGRRVTKHQVLFQLNTRGRYALPTTDVRAEDDIHSSIDRLHGLCLSGLTPSSPPKMHSFMSKDKNFAILLVSDEDNEYENSPADTVGGLYWRTLQEVADNQKDYDQFSLAILQSII